MRPGRGTYLPPHMRSGAAADATADGPRSLEELAPTVIKINVEYTQGSPFNFDLCPDHCVEEDATADSPQQELPATSAQPQDPRAQEPATEAAATEAAATEAATAAAQTGPGGANVQDVQETSPTSEQAATVSAAADAEAEALPGGLVNAAAAAVAAAGEKGEDGDAAGGAGEHARQDHRKTPPLEARHLVSPACPDSYQIKQLLRWFREACRETSDAFPKGDTKAVLSLPSFLTKRERALWHGEADRLGLKSQSTGFGDSRFLQIRPSGNYSKSSWEWGKQQQQHSSSSGTQGEPQAQMDDQADCAPRFPTQQQQQGQDSDGQQQQQQQQQRPQWGVDPGDQGGDVHGSGRGSGVDGSEDGDSGRGDRGISNSGWRGSGGNASGQGGRGGGGGAPRRPPDLAKQLWDWCQMEGGSLWNYSQGEIREALAAVGGDLEQLPAELAAVVGKRRRAQQLAAALQSKDEPAACALLAEAGPSNRLGWVRDPDSGGYPSHIAAWHGLGAFLTQLVGLAGPEVLQQHDANRATPVQLAQRRGHLELAAQLDLLLQQARGRTTTAPTTSNSNASNSSLAAIAPAETGDGGLPSTSADPVQGSGAQGLNKGVGGVVGERSEGLVVGAAGAGRGFGRAFGRGRGRETLGGAGHDGALPQGTTSSSSAAAAAATAAAAAGAAAAVAAAMEAPAAVAAAVEAPAAAAEPAATYVAAGGAGPEGRDSTAQEAAAKKPSTEAIPAGTDSQLQEQQNEQQQDKQQDEQKVADEQKQEQQEATGTGPGSAAAEGSAAGTADAEAAAADIYCSYSSRDDHSFMLFGRGGGGRGARGGGGRFRGRGGGGGRWQGGWRGGRGDGGRYGGGRGRGPAAEGFRGAQTEGRVDAGGEHQHGQ